MAVRRFSTGALLNLLAVVSLLLGPVSSPVPREALAAVPTNDRSSPGQTDPPLPTPTTAALIPPTATLPVTPTATPPLSPSLTTTPPRAPALALSKVTSAAVAIPGQVVTFTLTVSNVGTAPTRELELRDRLPAGLQLLPGRAPGAESDAAGTTLTWRLAGLDVGQAVRFSLAARVTAPAGAELTNAATVQAGEGMPVVTATAAVYVGVPGVICPETGGVLRSADGRVEVQFPPGAVERSIEVSHRPLEALDLPPDQHLFYRFELTAHQAGRPDLPVTTFTRPVTVTVAYRDAEVEGLLEEGLRLMTWDEGQGAWVPISTTVDLAANRLTARVSHFSVYAASGDDEVFFLPRIEAGQVSLLSGDSSFRYELEVPAGAGGLKVPLTLQYSGGIPNGLTKPLTGPDTHSDTGWVGVGWTFDVGRFEDELLTFNGLSTGVKVLSSQSRGTVSRCSPKGCTPGPGAPWCICESGSLSHRQQQTSEVRFYKIESDRFVGAVIDSLDQVEVWTKDGTHYIFGSQGYVPAGTCTLPSGSQVECGTGSRLYVTRNTGKRVYPAYKLDRIIDPHGNQVEIQYTVFPQPGSNHTQLKESYPSRILYTTNPGAGDSHAEYEIQFEVDRKAFDKQADKKFAETGYFLKTVNIWFHYDANDPANWATKKVLVRQYRFEYNAQLIASGTAYELVGITQYAPDQAQHLPTMSFGYTPRTIGWRINGPLGGSWYTVSRRFLQTVDNGYGGTLTFGYMDWNCYDYASAGEVGNEPFTCAGYGSGRLSWSQRQLVQSQSLSPGSGTALTTQYTYDQADVKWTRDPPAGDYGCRGRMTGGKYEICFEQFIGFEKVTEEWKSGSQTVKRTETRFHDTEGQPKIDQKRGKVEETWVKDGSGALYAHSITSYAVYSEAGWPEGVQFVYASQVIDDRCGAGGCQRKKTTYAYDLKWQNCGGAATTQYGNLTRVEEYESDTAPTPTRTTLTGYCPNPTAWIVDKPVFENRYEGGIDPNNPNAYQCRSSTWYIYSDDQDNPPAHWDQTVGSKGELRGVRRVLQWTPSWQLADTRYRHDPFGNVIQETVYKSYGTSTVWASTNARTTTTTYDPHHLFPVQVSGPTVGSYTPVEKREYYGVNESDGNSGDGLPGQLKRVRDENNQDDTWYEYDPFGRLTKEVRPGDSWELPTVQYLYRDGTSPRRITVYREVSGSGANRPVIHFYDGLGRVVQRRSESEEASQQVVESYTYDSLGRRGREYVPRFEPFCWESSPPEGLYSAYAYDALGRTTRVTHPDGTSVHYEYGYDSSYGLYTRAWDENGHRTEQFTDPMGRMVRVHEWWGTAAGEYHVTTYAYDVQDHLVQVTDAAGNSSWMVYDLLGRKTSMADPDMGTWWYRYDAVGNLTAQTDAREQTLWFSYDALNRLTKKDYPSGSDVYYVYDNGKGDATSKNSWGRLRVMYVGSESANGHLYEYDHRGRVVKEQVKLDSVPYETLYGYDAMDRVVTMTYPGGEVVITGYNAQGLPQTLKNDSNDFYVDGASYTALGQPLLITLGGPGLDLQLKYDYDSNRQRLQEIWIGVSDWPGRWGRFKYEYDGVGNVLKVHDRRWVDGVQRLQTQTFTYDALDRLVSAATSGDGTWGSYSESYSYNAIGNLMSKGAVTYTYPASGAGSVRPHAVTATSNGGSFSYDANGNMTGRRLQSGGPTYTQTWDYENRLKTVTVNGQTTTFTYDGNGALVQKVAGGVTTVYVGQHYEKNVTTGQVTQYYLFNGQRVAMRKGGMLSYLATDHLGTTSVVLDGSGGWVAESRHYPYGVERWSEGTLPTDYRFTGERLEAALGLYAMGARWYDPGLGRWLSADTVVPEPGNPQSLNRYTYGYGNPLKYRDPSGHWVETVWDVANIAWDIYEVRQDPSLLNIGCLVVDVAATVLPIVPAGAGLIVRGGKAAKIGIEAVTHADEVVDAARALSHVDEIGDVAKAVDPGVAAFRARRGAGIHPASTGKAFSDWFKAKFLPGAEGKKISGGHVPDIVDDAGTLVASKAKQIYELKNYTPQTAIGAKFWEQAKAYVEYATREGYTLNYVFGQRIADWVAQALTERGIVVWYIDDAGNMLQWIPTP